MTVNPGVVVIDATMKLVNAYLVNNQVPYNEFGSFIRGVNSTVLDMINADMSNSTVMSTPVVQNVPVQAPVAPAPKAVEKPVVLSKPRTDMTLEEAKAILEEPRGRGRPSLEVQARRQTAESVIAYHNYLAQASDAVSADEDVAEVEAIASAPMVSLVEEPVKRKRGRPSKAELAAREAAQEASTTYDEAPAPLQQQSESILLKRDTVTIPRQEEEPVWAEAEAPRRSRKLKPEEIHDYTNQGGLSDNPDAPNYRFKILDRDPVVPIKGSYTDDYVTCLLDGQKRKVLKRHLQTRYNMTERQYRRHFNLPDDFPVVAPSYTRTRSEMSKQRGFGKKAHDDFFKKPEEAKLIKRTRGSADVAA